MGGESRGVETEFEADEHGEKDPVGEGAFLETGVSEEEQSDPAQGGDQGVPVKESQERKTKREEKQARDQRRTELFGRVAGQRVFLNPFGVCARTSYMTESGKQKLESRMRKRI